MAVVGSIVGGAILGGAINIATPYIHKLLDDDDDDEEYEIKTGLTEPEEEEILWNKRRTEQIDWLNTMRQEESNSLSAFRRADEALFRYQTSTEPEAETYYAPNVELDEAGEWGKTILFISTGLVATYFIVKILY